jgi:hypothetical protein
VSQLPADPGIGSSRAPIGSKEWAERVRLNSQPIIDQAQSYPEKARGYVETVTKHRAWVLLNKRDGSTFNTFDEFCEEPKPYGWGISRARLEALIRVVATESGENANKVVALATVAPAQSPEPPPPGPGRGYKKANPQNEGQLFRNRNTTHAEAERLRAINRAPEPAQDLFRRDLMSKGVAVALGTTKRDTKPEKASVIAEATAAAVSIVESRKPATPAEKRKVRREVDAVVRERLGMERPSTFDRAVAAARVLTINDLRKLRTEIDRLIREGVK